MTSEGWTELYCIMLVAVPSVLATVVTTRAVLTMRKLEHHMNTSTRTEKNLHCSMCITGMQVIGGIILLGLFYLFAQLRWFIMRECTEIVDMDGIIWCVFEIAIFMLFHKVLSCYNRLINGTTHNVCIGDPNDPIVRIS